jgi:8-oxo-dGTP diphosphatase
MLPSTFTLTELQKLYEAVYGKTLDKRNFRKKILALNLVEPVDEVKREFGRPAQMYKASEKKLSIYNKIV